MTPDEFANVLDRLADDIEQKADNPSDYVLMRAIVDALRAAADRVAKS